MANVAFIKNPDGGFGVPSGYTPAEGANNLGQHFDKYQDSSGKTYSTYVNVGGQDIPASQARWATNSPDAYLRPDVGGSPNDPTPWSSNPDNLTADARFASASAGHATGGTMDMGFDNVPYDPTLMKVQAGVNDAAVKTRTLQGTAGTPVTYQPVTAEEKNLFGSFAGKTLDSKTFQDMLSHGSDPDNHVVVPTRPDTSAGGAGGTSGAAPLTTVQDQARAATGSEPTFDPTAAETQLRGQYGVDQMTANLEALDKQLLDIRTNESVQYAKVMSQPVSSAVRSKQLSIVKSQVSLQRSTLIAQRQLLTKQLSDAKNSISLMMSAAKSDYTSAKAKWTADYNNNLQHINLYDKVQAGTDPQSKIDKVQQTHDKASVQTILNNLSQTGYQNLTDDQKQNLDQLILSAYGPEFKGIEQAGLPAMIYSKTLTGVDGKKYLMGLHLNPDGSFNVSYTSPTRTTPTTQNKKDLISSMSSKLQGRVGTDGRVSPGDWRAAIDAWTASGQPASTFQSSFSQYAPSETISGKKGKF